MKRKLMNVFWSIIAIVISLPSVMITWYSLPVQDDFHYAYYAREMMAQGHGLVYTAFAYTIKYYKSFCGCYTSSFLGYFFSGIINCNEWGIRFFEFISLLIFYASLFFFLYMISYRIMKFEKKTIMPLYCILLFLFNGMVYYTSHEAFYWFITSVQYLFISSLILLGVSFFVLAIYEETNRKKYGYIIIAALLGFLGSGGTLCIAAFCCELYLLIGLWGIIEKNANKQVCIVMGVTFLGAIINGVAPGNYLRAGEQKTLYAVLDAVKMSVRYAIERWEFFIKNPVFWIAFILLAWIIFSGRRQETDFAFRLPILFAVCLAGG